MDIATLNAVIAKLQAEVDHCTNMIKWAYNNQAEMGGERDINMWCDCAVQAKHSLEIVQKMLDEELFARAEEAA